MKKWYIEDASCVVSQNAQTALTFTYYREPIGARHVKYVAEFGSSIEDAKRLMQEACLQGQGVWMSAFRGVAETLGARVSEVY